MKEVTIPPQTLGEISIETAFDALFSREFLKKIHGDSLRVSGWNEDDERTIQFSVNIDKVPIELRRIFCGNKLRITTHQTVRKEPGQWTVTNKLKMHCLGAEFVRVRPVFVLGTDADSHTTHISVRVEHDAFMPPPINRVVETFMASQTRRELESYEAIVREHFGIFTGHS